MSSAATLSHSPAFSPPKSTATAAAAPPRRRGRTERRPRAPPGLPVPARGPTPRAPPPFNLPGARPASPCRRLALPPPERSRRRRPWPCAAVSRCASPPCASPCAAGRPAPWPPGASARPPQRRRSAPPAGSAAAGCPDRARRPAPEAGEREQLGRRPLSSGARLSAAPPLYLLCFQFYSFIFS